MREPRFGRREALKKGRKEFIYHEGLEGMQGGNTTAKQNFTMKDMKNLKGKPLGVNSEA